MDRMLQRLWYERKPIWLLTALAPLSLLFAMLAAVRRGAYRVGLLRAVRIGRPVIVVGNITIGGTGKTPFVIWLAQYLRAQGRCVGIVLRGYRGDSREWPRDVTPQSTAREVGDEAILLALSTGAIVVAGRDRVAAARRAVERGADVILSDDGLQHYGLARDCEIAVVDAQRGFGNGWLLPAGPLREPVARLRRVDLTVLTQRDPNVAPSPSHSAAESAGRRRVIARSVLTEAISLQTGEVRPLTAFRDRHVHAIAGIGNPGAFFDALRAAHLSVDARALPDHAPIAKADLDFADAAPVLMTHKDAVKCGPSMDARYWYVPQGLEMSRDDAATVAAVIATAMQR